MGPWALCHRVARQVTQGLSLLRVCLAVGQGSRACPKGGREKQDCQANTLNQGARCRALLITPKGPKRLKTKTETS